MKKGFARYTENQPAPGMKKQAGQSGTDGNDELRTKAVQFTLSPTEYKNLVEQYSKSSCSTLALFCREKSLSKTVHLKNKKELISNHALEIYQLSKIGTNINQIARRLNSGGAHSQIISELEDELEELRRLKRAMLGQSMKGAKS